MYSKYTSDFLYTMCQVYQWFYIGCLKHASYYGKVEKRNQFIKYRKKFNCLFDILEGT